MKKEYKPEELRNTAEAIREATMPKSITPEMVGGTLLGVVNALGEVVEVLGEIPREHVRVKTKAYDGQMIVDVTEAIVYVDIFNAEGYPAVSFPRQELAVDENGEVEFDVPHGFEYAVFSKLEGLSASFQWVYKAAVDSREIELWNVPIGVWWYGAMFYYEEMDDSYRAIPLIIDHYANDWDEVEAIFNHTIQGTYSFEDYYNYGVLVATADTSFVIPPNSKSEEQMAWCDSRVMGQYIPTLPCINYETPDEAWSEVQNRARADMDGNMNTAKILAAVRSAQAAEWVGNKVENYYENRWLPSAGQAYLMYLNAIAINALMTQAMEADADTWAYVLLPYKKENGSWSSYEYWWTSTIYDDFCSWVATNTNRYNDTYVRAVSAFHFEY